MQEMLFLEDPGMCAAFLQYHGCEVVDSATGVEVDPSTEEVLSSEGLDCLLPPRMLRLPYRWWLSSDDWVKQTKQEVADEWTWERRKAFTERLGENVNADGTVTRCTFPQTVDPILARKYDLVLDSGVTLKDIILGAVDPGVDGAAVIKPARPAAPVRRPPPVETVKFGQAAQERTAVLLPNKKAVAARANGSVFGALPQGELPKNKSPFAAVSSPASSSPFGVTTTAASTSSGPFGKASNPFAATATKGPFGVATGGLTSASSSPFGVQPSVSAMPSPFLPLKSKSPPEEPPTEVVSRKTEAGPSPKQLSPSRPAGVQSPRVAKKKAADKVPVFEGLRTKLPPGPPTPTATEVVDRPAKATVATEVQEPQPLKSSGGGMSIFTVFSDDELEGWGHRPRRKRRIEESLVQVASSSSTEVEDELMMADLPDGLLDRFEHITIQDDISTWIDRDSVRRLEEAKVEETRSMQEMNSYLVQNLLRKRRALMAWKQVFFSRKQLRKLQSECRSSKHRPPPGDHHLLDESVVYQCRRPKRTSKDEVGCVGDGPIGFGLGAGILDYPPIRNTAMFYVNKKMLLCGYNNGKGGEGRESVDIRVTDAIPRTSVVHCPKDGNRSAFWLS
ncbi:hypothetical protein FOZ62_024772, partial [Perkinsus olseni]